MTHGRTSTYDINYHFVWCTQYRNPILKDNVAKFLREELVQICRQYRLGIQELHIEQQNYVSIIVSAPPKLSITHIMSCLKGISARRMSLRCPELQSESWQSPSKRLWDHSYYAKTLGNGNHQDVIDYLNHLKRKE